MPAVDEKLQIVYVPVNELRPYKGNPRKISDKGLQKLQRSVEEFGFVNPVLVQKGTNMIIAGHQRLKAAQAAGLAEVPVVWLDMDDVTAKAYNIADNRLQDESEWDFTPLADLLTELDTGAFDLTLTGFDDAELAKMMNYTPDGVKEDEVPEPPAEAVTKPGDIWQLGKHRVMCGDSTKAEDVDRLMAGAKADVVFTSPPYAQQRTYEGNMATDWDALMRGVFGLLPVNKQAQVFVNLGLVHREGRVIRYWDSWLDFMESSGWPLFGWYVWDKLNGMPGDWGGRLAPSHEWIFHFCVTHQRPQKTEECKHAGAPIGKSTQRNRDGSLKHFTGEGQQIQSHKIPDSVVRLSPANQSGSIAAAHPAVFPVALPSVFLTAWPGSLLYEPFAGSGTCIIAAEQLGQTCYGMELTPCYVDIIVKRWEQLTGKKAELVQNQ